MCREDLWKADASRSLSPDGTDPLQLLRQRNQRHCSRKCFDASCSHEDERSNSPQNKLLPEFQKNLTDMWYFWNKTEITFRVSEKVGPNLLFPVFSKNWNSTSNFLDKPVVLLEAQPGNMPQGFLLYLYSEDKRATILIQQWISGMGMELIYSTCRGAQGGWSRILFALHIGTYGDQLGHPHRVNGVWPQAKQDHTQTCTLSPPPSVFRKRPRRPCEGPWCNYGP